MALTSGLPSSGGSKGGGSQSALIVRLQTAIAKEKNPSKKARLKLQLKKLTTKGKVGTPKAGDAMAKYASIRSYVPKRNADKSTLEQFAGTLSDYSFKGSDDDWTKDYFKMWEKTGDAEEDAWLDDPGLGYKKGGRLKKAKKKSKKSRPKGIRIALRGYGKAMGRG